MGVENFAVYLRLRNRYMITMAATISNSAPPPAAPAMMGSEEAEEAEEADVEVLEGVVLSLL